MVLGKGLVAKKFNSYDNDEAFLIFASGVSNSKSATEIDFEREKSLLLKTISDNKDKILVYFSTCSIYDSLENNSNYVLHKLNMENILKLNAPHYYIFRVSNLVGFTSNKFTVLNFLYNAINNQNKFQLWQNVSRNLIDIDDMFLIIDYILQSKLFTNSTINIANINSYSVTYIVSTLENFLHKKAITDRIEKGTLFDIDTSLIKPIYDKVKIDFSDDYLPKLLIKYFSV